MAKERYADLVYQLGDLARDRLAGKPLCPPSMQAVYAAEEVLISWQESFAQLEQQMNDADAEQQAFRDRQQEEKVALEAAVKKHRRAVDTVEGEVKALRKKYFGMRADYRYSQDALAKIEARHKELEGSIRDPAKLEASRQQLKANRLRHLKLGREVQEAEQAVHQALSVVPGQPGASGILAHKRLLEMEDEAEEISHAHRSKLAAFEDGLADAESEIKACEEALDQALFALGEDVYKARVADAALLPLYARLDRSART